MRAYIYRTVESVMAQIIGGTSNDSVIDVDQLSPDLAAKITAYSREYVKKQVGSGAVTPSSIVTPATSASTVRKDAWSRALTPKEQYYRDNNYIASLNPGFYIPMRSTAYYGDAGVTSVDGSRLVGAEYRKNTTRSVSELVYFTQDSVPFTDASGYQHIGAFPYGANLSLNDSMELQDLTDLGTGPAAVTSAILDIAPDNTQAANEFALADVFKGAPSVTLASHMDTLLTTPTTESSTPTFTPTITAKDIYGGVLDIGSGNSPTPQAK